MNYLKYSYIIKRKLTREFEWLKECLDFWLWLLETYYKGFTEVIIFTLILHTGFFTLQLFIPYIQGLGETMICAYFVCLCVWAFYIAWLVNMRVIKIWIKCLYGTTKTFIKQNRYFKIVRQVQKNEKRKTRIRKR